jgi:hypothetical protein
MKKIWKRVFSQAEPKTIKDIFRHGLHWPTPSQHSVRVFLQGVRCKQTTVKESVSSSTRTQEANFNVFWDLPSTVSII